MIDIKNIAIKKFDKIFNSPLCNLIATAVHELSAAELMGGGAFPDWDCKAIYAEMDGKIVGFIVWKSVDWVQEAQISLGYVLPDYRRQGIYQKMFEALEAEATKLKLRSITGYTDVKNVVLQNAAIKQGREAISIGYRKKLPFVSEVITNE